MENFKSVTPEIEELRLKLNEEMKRQNSNRTPSSELLKLSKKMDELLEEYNLNIECKS